jgi:hypothetical protein
VAQDAITVTEEIKNKEHPGYLTTMRSHKNVRSVVKNRWMFSHQNNSSGGEHWK